MEWNSLPSERKLSVRNRVPSNSCLLLRRLICPWTQTILIADCPGVRDTTARPGGKIPRVLSTIGANAPLQICSISPRNSPRSNIEPITPFSPNLSSLIPSPLSNFLTHISTMFLPPSMKPPSRKPAHTPNSGGDDTRAN